MASFCASDLGIAGIPATTFNAACSSSTYAVRDAWMWIASGFYDIVLAAGTERGRAPDTPFAQRIMQGGARSFYEDATGLTFIGVFALMAHLYAKKYGIPLETLEEQMAQVAVKSHYYASLNPKAQFHKEITVEEVLNSEMLASPLRFLNCCPLTDGAAAVVLASADVAKKLTNKPVHIIGVGQSSGGAICSTKDITIHPARVESAKQAYNMAGITSQDIDVCEVHDCFSIAENLGFFGYGDGSYAVARGDTKIGGKIPINISGGLKGVGHPTGATGVRQVYDIVKQLRGECGERQVEGAKIGMTDTMGGTGAAQGNIILGRGW
jgi:acetyl-CoA C-acetyltransferase/acetyl-CoA acyltransferase